MGYSPSSIARRQSPLPIIFFHLYETGGSAREISSLYCLLVSSGDRLKVANHYYYVQCDLYSGGGQNEFSDTKWSIG